MYKAVFAISFILIYNFMVFYFAFLNSSKRGYSGAFYDDNPANMSRAQRDIAYGRATIGTKIKMFFVCTLGGYMSPLYLFSSLAIAGAITGLVALVAIFV